MAVLQREKRDELDVIRDITHGKQVHDIKLNELMSKAGKKFKKFEKILDTMIDDVKFEDPDVADIKQRMIERGEIKVATAQ